MALSCKTFLAMFRIHIPTGEQVKQPVIYTSDVLRPDLTLPSRLQKKTVPTGKPVKTDPWLSRSGMTPTVLRVSHSIAMFFQQGTFPNIQGHSQCQHLQAIDMHSQVLDIYPPTIKVLLALLSEPETSTKCIIHAQDADCFSTLLFKSNGIFFAVAKYGVYC